MRYGLDLLVLQACPLVLSMLCPKVCCISVRGIFRILFLPASLCLDFILQGKYPGLHREDPSPCVQSSPRRVVGLWPRRRGRSSGVRLLRQIERARGLNCSQDARAFCLAFGSFLPLSKRMQIFFSLIKSIIYKKIN